VFEANEERELTATDPNKQNLNACMALADFSFSNNGTFEELYQQLDAVVNKL
jgi:dephospho-CoA kinase